MRGCDFCSSREPARWEYRCSDFTALVVVRGAGVTAAAPWSSRGSWLACDRCSALIDAGEWLALSERALKAAAKSYELEVGRTLPRERRRPMRKGLRELHAEFRRRRVGEKLDLRQAPAIERHDNRRSAPPM